MSEQLGEAYCGDYPWIPADYEAQIRDVANRVHEHCVWVGADRASGELLATLTTAKPRGGSLDIGEPQETGLKLLGVFRAARHRGIGEYMMQQALVLTSIRSVERLVLNTSADMPRARALYERLGFDQLREREQEILRSDGTSYTLIWYGMQAG